MTKKLFLVFIIVFAVANIAAAQEKAKNALSFSFGFNSFEASYERVLTKHFSVLGDVSYFYSFTMNEYIFLGKGRLYPFGKTFFLDLGLGYSYGNYGIPIESTKGYFFFFLPLPWNYLIVFSDILSRGLLDLFGINIGTPEKFGGFLFQPCLGWKIDIGKPNRFVIPINMGVDLKFGEKKSATSYLRIGLGYAF